MESRPNLLCHRVSRAEKILTFVAVLSACLLITMGRGHAEKMVVAWSAVSALNSPFWVMNDAGFLKQEGLDMELVYIASSPTVARATLTGDIVLSGANSQVQELINEGFYTKLWGKNP